MDNFLAWIAGAALLAGVTSIKPAAAADTGASRPLTVAIVEVERPWYVPAFVVRSKMRDTEPQYTALPGLLFKYFSISEDDKFGGIYLWRDAATAHAWFNEAWFANVLRTRGTPANVRFFDVVRVQDMVPGGVARDDHSDAAATLLIASGQSDTSIEPGNAPGLLRRYDVRTADGHPARIDLWSSSRAADNYYDAPRLTHFRAPFGDVQLKHFSTPILLPSSLPENQLAARS